MVLSSGCVAEQKERISGSPVRWEIDRTASEKGSPEGDLKGGDGREGVAREGFFEMGDRAGGGRVAGWCVVDFRRRADGGQSGPQVGLCVLKSLPDPVGCRVAHAAVEIRKGFLFVTACGVGIEELPKLVGTEKESFDFVGDPRAEGASTTSGLISVATKDPRGTNGFVSEIDFVIATQGTMAVERADFFAVGALLEFKIQQERIALCLVTKDSGRHGCWLLHGK